LASRQARWFHFWKLMCRVEVACTGPVWLQASLGGENLPDVERLGGDHLGSVPALLGVLSASSRAARLA
jgi:hypothetical protein